MRFRRFSWAIVTLCTVALVGQRPGWAGDSEFVAALADSVKNFSPNAQRMAQQLGDANNIKVAKGICGLLDKPQVKTLDDLLNGIVAQSFFEVPTPKLMGTPDEQATGVGEYLGIVMVNGTLEYCPKNQAKVRLMFGL